MLQPRLLPPEPFGWFCHLQLYPGAGADIVMESISLTDASQPILNEQNRCLRQPKSYNLCRGLIEPSSQWRETSIQARGINGMAISVNPSVIALVGTGWRSVGGQLLASGVLLLSGHQDIGLRARMGAAFWV